MVIDRHSVVALNMAEEVVVVVVLSDASLTHPTEETWAAAGHWKKGNVPSCQTNTQSASFMQLEGRRQLPHESQAASGGALSTSDKPHTHNVGFNGVE